MIWIAIWIVVGYCIGRFHITPAYNKGTDRGLWIYYNTFTGRNKKKVF